jgi:hypothetical protein
MVTADEFELIWRRTVGAARQEIERISSVSQDGNQDVCGVAVVVAYPGTTAFARWARREGHAEKPTVGAFSSISRRSGHKSFGTRRALLELQPPS